MITIQLCRHLAQFFPEKIQVSIKTPKEALAALFANFEGFSDYLHTAAEAGVAYEFFFNGQRIDLSQLSAVLPQDGVLSIRPVPSGSGQGAKIIAGVALLGLGIAGVGFLAFTPTTFMITGAALLLSAFRGQKKPKEAVKSNMFGGNESTMAEGGRMAVAYGIIMTAGMVLSAKIKTTYTPLGGRNGKK